MCHGSSQQWDQPWVISIKDKNRVSLVNAFQGTLDSSKGKPNKKWVDSGSDIYNKFFIKWLKNNNTEMYSNFNEEKFVFAEWFTRPLRNKIYKHMTAVSKIFILIF